MRLLVILSIFLFGCAPNRNEDKIILHDSCKTTTNIPIDTTELHFDCIVEECYEDQPGDWMVFTECGICIHTDKEHHVGDTLKNFQSPKHK